MKQFAQYIIATVFLSILFVVDASAQVGINILQPDSSAILQLESTDRGFLPPRLTRAQRDNIFSPKPGLMVYNTTDSIMQYFNGSCWLSTCKFCTGCTSL